MTVSPASSSDSHNDCRAVDIGSSHQVRGTTAASITGARPPMNPRMDSERSWNGSLTNLETSSQGTSTSSLMDRSWSEDDSLNKARMTSSASRRRLERGHRRQSFVFLGGNHELYNSAESSPELIPNEQKPGLK
eukprot:CAMPEP_0194044326 /NCGR_PEP_ID=MMETSP0009_2-20130614/15817_1 /TAXON_ID=210454 /ORGANISM="Grammatophora oceanica, Strain CCMP 410" /LENGTH=133 /DNA_ID=CAMNT_0038688823 /DNA_START=98 /DNA_END=499 /DNA_ORIENTATION=-